MISDEKIMGLNKGDLFTEIMIQMHTLWINNRNRKLDKNGFKNLGISDLVEYITELGIWLRDEDKSNSWLQKNLNRYTTGEYSHYESIYEENEYLELPDEFYEDLLIHLFPNLV